MYTKFYKMKKAFASLLCVLMFFIASCVGFSYADDGDISEDYFPVGAVTGLADGDLINTKTWTEVEGWRIEGQDVNYINEDGYLRVFAKSEDGNDTTSSMRSDFAVPHEFEFETRFRIASFSRYMGIRINTGKHRVNLLIFPGYIAYTPPDSQFNVTYPIHNEWHDVRIVAEKDMGRIYIDGNLIVDSYPLRPDTAAARIIYYATSRMEGTECEMQVEYTKLSVPSYFKIQGEITQPTANTIIKSPVEPIPVHVSANSMGGAITKVDILVDGKKVHTIDQKPFIYYDLKDMLPGNRLISAVIYDQSGAFRETEAVPVTVLAGVSVSMKSITPKDMNVTDEIKLQVITEGALTNVEKLTLYLDGVKIDEKFGSQGVFTYKGKSVGILRFTVAAHGANGLVYMSEPTAVNVSYQENWQDKELWSATNKNPVPNEGKVNLYGRSVITNSLVEIPFSYIYSQDLNFPSVSSGIDVGINNGRNELRLKIFADSIEYNTADGARKFEIPVAVNEDINLKAVVFEEIAQIYMEGEFLFSYLLPYSKGNNFLRYEVTCGCIVTLGKLSVEMPYEHTLIYGSGFSTITDWSGEGSLTVQDGEILLSSNSQMLKSIPEMPQDYVLEFRSRVNEFTTNGEMGISVNDGGWAFDLRFKKGGIYTLNSPYGNRDAELIRVSDVSIEQNQWQNWKVVTVKGISQVYCNGVLVANLRLPLHASKKEITIRTNSTDAASWVVDSILLTHKEGVHLYSDNFDNIEKDRYWCIKEGEWEYSNGFGLKSGNTTGGHAMIHVLSKNNRISADFEFLNDKKSDVQLLYRWFDEKNYLYAGYNDTKGAMEIVQVMRGVTTVLASKAYVLNTGLQYTMATDLNNSGMDLYINGSLVLSASGIDYNNNGRVGVRTKDYSVRFNRFDYRGDSNVTPNVNEGFVRPDTPSAHSAILDLGNGRIMTMWGDNSYNISNDGGRTWGDKVTGYPYTTNIMRLPSGNILRIGWDTAPEGYQLNRYYSQVSTDGGVTFGNKSYINDDYASRVMMNDRISIAASGRIFFPSNDSLNEGRGVTVPIYSDDEGATWIKSETVLDMDTTGINIAEATIVDLPDGTLKLYARCDRGYVYETTSTDNGVTWDLNLKPTPFISPMVSMKITRDQYTGDYYMHWAHENINENPMFQLPREKYALAVSRDGTKTWEYVMGTDTSYFSPLSNFYRNGGLVITEDYVIANVAKPNDYEPTATGRYARYQWYTILDKKQIRSDIYFPKPRVGDEIVAFEEMKINDSQGESMVSGGIASSVTTILPSSGIMTFEGQSTGFDQKMIEIEKDEIWVTPEILDKLTMLEGTYDMVNGEVVLRFAQGVCSILPGSERIYKNGKEISAEGVFKGRFISLTKLFAINNGFISNDSETIILARTRYALTK